MKLRGLSIPFFLTFALAAFAAQDKAVDTAKVKVDTTAKAGAVTKYTAKLNFDLSGIEAEATATLKRTVKKVEGGISQFQATWDDLKVTANGSEQPVTVSDCLYKTSDAGMLKSLEGGIEGLDNVRMLIAVTFVSPGKELAAGEKYTAEGKADEKAGIPAYKYNGVYVGKEKLGDKEVLKFTADIKEVGTDAALESALTVYLDDKGTVVKVESKFKGLPIPAAGSSATGKILLEVAK